LGNCGLTEIPEELENLTWLIWLSLGSEKTSWNGQLWENSPTSNVGEKNMIRNISKLAKLKCLEVLNLSENSVSDLTAISDITTLRCLSIKGTKVTNISSLSNLTHLEWIDLSSSSIYDINPLEKLTELKDLSLENTKVKDLDAIKNLQLIEKINLSYTEIIDFSKIKNLINIKNLNLSNSKFSDLKILENLLSIDNLDLSNSDITELTSLSKLSKLKHLNASGTLISELSLDHLSTELVKIDVSKTKISSIHSTGIFRKINCLNLSFSRVSNLKFASEFYSLTTLDISNTKISSLISLSNLKNIKFINISHTKIRDLSPLKNNSEILELHAGNTKVEKTNDIINLPSLTKLSIRNTKIDYLIGFENLENLVYLDFSGTKISNITPLLNLIRKNLTIHVRDSIVLTKNMWEIDLIDFEKILDTGPKFNYSGIFAFNCQITVPPIEIVSQGKSAIINFFEEIKSNPIDYLYEAKMLILGEGGSGKTSLFRRLFRKDLPLPSENETTKGISIHRHEFLLKNGRTFRLNVWDFGGQEIYHATHQFFLTQRSLYLLLDDTRKDNKSVSDSGFMYWLDMIDILSAHSPVLIFQNEKGGRSKTIDFSGIKAKYTNVKEKYAGNLEELDSVDNFRNGIEFFAENLNHVGEALPGRWIKVRADIERKAAETPYITIKEYFSIYQNHIDFDRDKALHLSRYLHDLGVFLHFQNDEILSRSVILQNTWATEAVFRILDDEIVKTNMGRFSEIDCKRIWIDESYNDMHLELLALMQRFELCYLLPDTPKKTWLATQLLPPTKPSALVNWSKPDDLVVRYHYDFMPKGIISRLMVRLHRFVKAPQLAYVTGVFLEKDNTKVFVELLPSGAELEIRGRGVEKKALLSVVCSDLDALNSSFEGLNSKIQKRIPCICSDCTREEVPHFFSQKNLLKRLEDNKNNVECPNSYDNISVIALLDGIKGEIPMDWSTKNKKPIARRIKIFLASSFELKQERDEFELHFRQTNDELLNSGIYLEIIRWENFLNSMSLTRLQDEYNEKVRSCDIFVSIFSTKAGSFTEEEFDVAYDEFKKTGKPKIYTFFKKTIINTETANEKDLVSLWAFQKKLKDLGHFYTNFENTADLKLQFQQQLILLKKDN